MSEIKGQYSGFLNLEGIYYSKENGKSPYKLRVNPIHIIYYYEGWLSQDTSMPCVIIYAGGEKHLLDTTIEEFDKFMETVERGISFDDNDLK